MIEQSIPVEAFAPPAGAPVLVSGASFAGLATAYWLNELGYRVTLIEVASGLRRGEAPVDIEGETIGVLARMEMIDAVRAKAPPPARSSSRVPMSAIVQTAAVHRPAWKIGDATSPERRPSSQEAQKQSPCRSSPRRS